MLFTRRCALRVGRRALATAAALLLSVPPAFAQSDSDDATLESAVYLIRSSLAIQRDGQHHRLLQATRLLHDPALQPLFARLADSTHPTLRIHGILGMAECRPDHKLDLLRLAAIEDGRVQAEIISAAMDSGLLNNEQARQLLGWEDVDPAVKVLVTMQLLSHRQEIDRQVLANASQSPNLARRALASLMLLQLDEEQGLHRLLELNESDDPERDAVRMMVLTTALRFDFNQVAPWAWKVSNEVNTPRRLRLLALRTAMRFGAAGADEMWTQQFRTSMDVVTQTRLALLALELSPWMRPALYEPMRRSDDPLIARMGDAGQAVAQRQKVAEAVEALIALHHALANDWALDHASQYATHRDAVRILHALIRAFEQEGSPRTRARRLDHAVAAAKVLAEKDIDKAVELLRPIVTSPDSDPALVQGVLLGLIGSKAPQPHRVVAGAERLSHPAANRMAVFLTARHSDKPLAPTQMEDLALLVRGGGGVPDTLRIQAAWTYLKITGQTERALQQALAG